MALVHIQYTPVLLYWLTIFQKDCQRRVSVEITSVTFKCHLSLDAVFQSEEIPTQSQELNLDHEEFEDVWREIP